ncbi:hypothetical protein Tco_0849954 [Tanacetum coccineum]
MTFKVLLHHYGRFTTPPGRRFVDGMVATIDPVELESFSTNQMKLILTNCLGYDENSATFLYIKKPSCSLDSGLIPLDDAIQDNELILTNYEEEAILEEQILALMHRFADRFTDRRVEINNLMVLHDHPLVDYGKYALGCMTGADMKKCVYLKSVMDELLRSMEEKRQLMANYRDIFAPQLHESAGGLSKTKLVSHSCSLAGSTSAMEVSIPIAFVLPDKEHECNESFKLGRSPALS